MAFGSLTCNLSVNVIYFPFALLQILLLLRKFTFLIYYTEMIITIAIDLAISYFICYL